MAGCGCGCGCLCSCCAGCLGLSGSGCARAAGARAGLLVMTTTVRGGIPSRGARAGAGHLFIMKARPGVSELCEEVLLSDGGYTKRQRELLTM